MAIIKTLEDVLQANEPIPSQEWNLRLISNADCCTYVVWNSKTREACLIDPKQEDLSCYLTFKNELKDYLWLAVVDTHTHADHISAAYESSQNFSAPLIMHHASPSQRVHLRIGRSSFLPCRAGRISFFCTPGHTPDGLCVQWGPFLFTGDTVLYGDVGRDDLPGGNPTSHYESVQLLKQNISDNTLVLPGHDSKGGRITSWGTQLKINGSLTQDRETFIQECTAFEAPAPALLKKSLFENFK